MDLQFWQLDKLRLIEATGVLEVDLLWLNGNYRRALFHHVRKSSVTRLRELAEPRRRAALVCFLWQSYGCCTSASNQVSEQNSWHWCPAASGIDNEAVRN
jgi:hypothetical protein